MFNATAFSMAAIWSAAIFGVICLARTAPVIEYEDEMEDDIPLPSMVDRVNQLIAGATRDREQLEARAVEIVRLHGYSAGSCEAETLEAVVWDGMPYEEAMERVMRLRRQRQRNN